MQVLHRYVSISTSNYAVKEIVTYVTLNLSNSILQYIRMYIQNLKL